jgi:4a-hydroxytetrahydrobiopterin dehydratase
VSEEEINQRLHEMPEWARSERHIQRRYRFESFLNAIQFTNEVAHIAEEMNHHPFIAIDYRFVTLKLTSWHAGGLTEADFIEAAACDQRYLQFKQGSGQQE